MSKTRLLSGLLLFACCSPLSNAQAPALPLAVQPPKPAILLSTRVTEALIRHRVEPRLPSGSHGSVVVAAEIDAAGNVVSAHGMSGPPDWISPVETAVRQWKYKPYLVDGVPVPFRTTIRVVVGS